MREDRADLLTFAFQLEADRLRLIKYCMFLLVARMSLQAAGRELMPDASKDSAANRWLNKKVVASRVLDDREDPAHWAAFSTGAPEVVDARAAQKATESNRSVAEISFSQGRSRNGRQSLRLRMPTRLDIPGPKTAAGGPLPVFCDNSTAKIGAGSIASRCHLELDWILKTSFGDGYRNRASDENPTIRKELMGAAWEPWIP